MCPSSSGALAWALCTGEYVRAARVCVKVSVRVCLSSVYIYKYKHICIYIYMYIYIYACVCVCVCISVTAGSPAQIAPELGRVRRRQLLHRRPPLPYRALEAAQHRARLLLGTLPAKRKTGRDIGLRVNPIHIYRVNPISQTVPYLHPVRVPPASESARVCVL